MWYLTSLLVFKIILDWIGYTLLAPVFPPYTLIPDINWFKLIESYLLLLLLSLAMPKDKRQPSTYFLGLLFLLSFVPILSVYGLANEERLPTYAITAFWLGVALLTRVPFKFSLPPLRRGPYFSAIIVGGLIVYGLFAVMRLGPSFRMNFSEVYDVRASFVEQSIPLSSYLFPWLAFVVCPLLLGWMLTQGRYVFAALVGLLQLQLFTTTGNKIYLLGTALVLLLLWVVTRRKDLHVAISWGLSGLALTGWLTFNWFRDIWVSGILVNRLLVVPAVITYYYFDYFSQKGFLFFSYGFLRGMVDYPYQVSPYKLIGYLYFGNPDNNANTGLIGDAYMNLGYTGLVLVAVGLAIVLKLIDSLCTTRDRRLVMAAAALPVMNLVNVGFFTTLLTNGLGLALLLGYLLPVPNKQPSQDDRLFKAG